MTLVFLAMLACGGETAAPGAGHAPEGAPAEQTGGTATGEAAPAGAETTATAPAGAGPAADKLTAAQTAVHPFQPWADADTKLKELVGPPMKVEGDTHLWWAKDGEKCQVLTVVKMADSVGSASLEAKDCPA